MFTFSSFNYGTLTFELNPRFFYMVVVYLCVGGGGGGRDGCGRRGRGTLTDGRGLHLRALRRQRGAVHGIGPLADGRCQCRVLGGRAAGGGGGGRLTAC